VPDAGTVDQDIYASKGSHYGLDNVSHFLLGGNISVYEHRSTAMSSNPLSDTLPTFAINVHDDDSCPLPLKGETTRATYTACATGDHYDLPLKIHLKLLPTGR
jgi:hypothetical protein